MSTPQVLDMKNASPPLVTPAAPAEDQEQRAAFVVMLQKLFQNGFCDPFQKPKEPNDSKNPLVVVPAPSTPTTHRDDDDTLSMSTSDQTPNSPASAVEVTSRGGLGDTTTKLEPTVEESTAASEDSATELPALPPTKAHYHPSTASWLIFAWLLMVGLVHVWKHVHTVPALPSPSELHSRILQQGRTYTLQTQSWFTSSDHLSSVLGEEPAPVVVEETQGRRKKKKKRFFRPKKFLSGLLRRTTKT
jgi:hypothetical protein